MTKVSNDSNENEGFTRGDEKYKADVYWVSNARVVPSHDERRQCVRCDSDTRKYSQIKNDSVRLQSYKDKDIELAQ